MANKYGRETALNTEIGKWGIMGKKNSHSLKKFQKELERKKKAREKMARRQGKKEQNPEADRQ